MSPEAPKSDSCPLPFRHNELVLPSNRSDYFGWSGGTLLYLARDPDEISSPSPEVNEYFPVFERANQDFIELNEVETHSTHGLMWECSSDYLAIKSKTPDRQFTRRDIPAKLDGKHVQRQIIISANNLDINYKTTELPHGLKLAINGC